MSPRTVLIVDDEHEITRGLSIRLRSAGYDVITASDGPDGMNAAIGTKPWAIILDLCMPNMNGFETLEKLREHEETVGIPVIVLSADTKEATRLGALELGAKYFVDKPYHSSAVLATLRNIGANPLSTVNFVRTSVGPDSGPPGKKPRHRSWG